MYISGWGNFPKVNSVITSYSDYSKLQEIVKKSQIILPNGLLRSYGDSALSENTFSSKRLNKFLNFDTNRGILHAEAGVSLKEINEITIPKGWFLPVTPGTKYITVGGAIASDVHGKNHHKSGTFGKFVNWIKLLIADGSIVNCSMAENTDLFRATIGGMGLTGIILEAEFQLQQINSSSIVQKTVKTKNLDELLEKFEKYKDYTYSVSWIDTASRGKNSGRALLFLGEHDTNNEIDLEYNQKKQILNVPFFPPKFFLNSFLLKELNFLYFLKELKEEKDFSTDFDSFFYPLDAILNWNRIYGKSGFAQYQFVIPFENASETLKLVLKTLSDFGLYSFVTVLKVFGEENEFYLSFPKKGYTLAMDFAISEKSLKMFDKLDEIIWNAGGRVYLTKDARMSSEFFKEGYTKLIQFKEVKQKFDPNNKFQSLQSKRLGI